jgi:hypothetical protein
MLSPKTELCLRLTSAVMASLNHGQDAQAASATAVTVFRSVYESVTKNAADWAKYVPELAQVPSQPAGVLSVPGPTG